jgi:hypothetical protein
VQALGLEGPGKVTPALAFYQYRESPWRGDEIISGRQGTFGVGVRELFAGVPNHCARVALKFRCAVRTSVSLPNPNPLSAVKADAMLSFGRVILRRHILLNGLEPL